MKIGKLRRIMAGALAGCLMLNLGMSGAVAKAADTDEVTLYPTTPKAVEATAYTVTVNGKKLFIEDKVTYDGKIRDDFKTTTARFMHSGNGPLDVVVSVPGSADLADSEVYPRRAEIHPSIDQEARTISFTIEPEMLETSMQYIVAVPGLKNIILMVDPPETDKPSPDAPNVYNIMEQENVKNDGTKCTEAIQKAIDKVGEDPDLDILYIPNGHYVTGRLEIKHDDVAIYLESGVLIQGAYDAANTDQLAEDYPFGETGFGHNDRRNGSVFIQPMGKRTLVRDEVNGDHYEVEPIKNFKLYGRGVIDGSGRQIYEKIGGANDNQANWIHLFEAKDVDGLEIEGVILRNSSNWCFKLENVNHAKINNLKVINSTSQRYADGMDLSSVTNATYENSMSYSQDDAIAIMTLQLKNPSNTGYDGPPQGETKNITFKNHLGYTDCSAVRIGWDSTDAMENLNFEGCEWVKYDAGALNIHRLQDNNKYGPITFKNCRWDHADNAGMKTFATCYGTDGNGFSQGQINAEEIRFENCLIEGLYKGVFNIQGNKIDKWVFDSTRISNGTADGLVTKQEEIPNLRTSNTTFEFTDTYGIAQSGKEGRYQAETMPLSGRTTISSGIAGYDGFGFAKNMNTISSGITLKVQVEQEEDYDVIFRYSSGKDAADNLKLTVNGTEIKDMYFASTKVHSVWADHKERIHLKQGANTIVLKAPYTAEDSIYLDYIDVAEGDPDSAMLPQEVVLNDTLEAEASVIEDGEIINDAAASQTKAVILNSQGQSITYGELKEDAKRLKIRYKAAQDTTLDLYNGKEKVETVSFPATGDSFSEVLITREFATGFRLKLAKGAKDAAVLTDYVKFESGRPALVNLALNRTATTNAAIASNHWRWYGVRNLVDGIVDVSNGLFNTAGSASPENPQDVLIDLEQQADIYEINLLCTDTRIQKYAVYAGNDPENLELVSDAREYKTSAGDYRRAVVFNDGQEVPVNARYIKVSCLGPSNFKMNEIEVMGVKTGDAAGPKTNVAVFKPVTVTNASSGSGTDGYSALNDWNDTNQWSGYASEQRPIIIEYDLLRNYALNGFSNSVQRFGADPNATMSVEVRDEDSGEWTTVYDKKTVTFEKPSDMHEMTAWPIEVCFDRAAVGRYVRVNIFNTSSYGTFSTYELGILGSLVYPAGVELNKSTLTLPPRKAETLTAKVVPEDAANKKISWSSSDTTVATVDQKGQVTAAEEGQATITARTIDGGHTAACVVTVRTNVETQPIKSAAQPEPIQVIEGTTADQLVLPQTTAVTLADDSVRDLKIEWDRTSYLGEAAKTYTLTGKIITDWDISNPDNIEVFIEVRVIRKPEKAMISIKQPNEISVQADTAFDQLGLPGQVEVTLDDGSIIKLNVAWDEAGYADTSAGAVNTVTGTLELTEQEDYIVTNPQNLMPSVTVNILLGDLENLALKRPVSASSSSGNFVPENAVDGNDYSSFWRSGGTATASNPEWIAVELEALSHIYEVEITLPGNWSSTYPFTVQVLASEDGENFEPVTEPTDCTLIGTPGGNGNRAFAYESGTAFTAKYVKLVYTKCDYNVNLGELYINGVKSGEQVPVDVGHLRSLYTKAIRIDNESGKYTTGSFRTFEAARARAEAILLKAENEEEITEIEVAQAVTDLESAMNGLADRSILKMIIEIADGHVQNGDLEQVIPIVKEQFESALKEANNVYKNPNASQNEIDDAWENMMDAIQGLGFTKGDKTELIILVGKSAILDLGQYEDGQEKDTFIKALKAAREVLDDPNAIQDEIEKAYAELEAAKDGLVAIPEKADKRELEKVVLKAEAYDLSKYVDGTEKDTFTATLAAAADMLRNNDDATQTEVEKATADLLAAMAKLRLRADKSVLTEAISKAKAVNASRYTKESVNTMNHALKEAEEILNDESLTTDQQDKVDDAAKALNTAVEKLEPKRVEDIFDDINADSWFRDFVQYVFDRDIMTGLNDTEFGSDMKLKRSHFATMLYRMEGEPEAEYSGKFKDVPNETFYTDAVMWASSKEVEVINGYEDGKFGPDDDITREQMAVMLYRYAQYKGYDVSGQDDLGGFKDAKDVSEFAAKALEWAVGAELIKGEGESGRLNPQGETSRAVCAAIMQRFIEKNVK